ncbi:MAG TPA: ferredoxin family protein [Candidatus Bathyarchaeota archaeon]|nr:ferredoxin family protein [Candidatus Bathyarchaeota archaeon]
MASYRIVVDPDRCLGCGACVRACAFGVLELIDDVAYAVRPSECRGCMDCVKACEQGAIEVLLAGRESHKNPCSSPGPDGGGKRG